jgi:hypothetical protein
MSNFRQFMNIIQIYVHFLKSQLNLVHFLINIGHSRILCSVFVGPAGIRTERKETALWAFLALGPACRGGSIPGRN